MRISDWSSDVCSSDLWWRELDLPNRTIIGQDGRVLADAPEVLETDAARSAYAELAGKTVFSAKKRIVELLQESGEMIGDPKPFTHELGRASGRERGCQYV